MKKDKNSDFVFHKGIFTKKDTKNAGTIIPNKSLSSRIINKETFFYVLLLCIMSFSSIQAQPAIIDKSNYTVTGTETLIATQSITLKPNTWIKTGSVFVAKIGFDPNYVDPNAPTTNSPTPYTPIVFSDENYILTRIFKSPMQNATGITDIKEVSETITYFDGLGRPMQKNDIRFSSTGKDIITPIEYDNFGRQDKDYMPYSSGQSNGSYIARISSLSDVAAFYNTPGYGNTQNPFSQKKFEESPLNRIMKQAAPGNDWALNTGHEIKLDYQTNTTADAVKLFSVTANWDIAKGLFDIPTALTPADYLELQLYKTITYDENAVATLQESAGSTIEFKNKEGQVVLKRTYDNTAKHDTYYVYDQYGNLTFVIPPLVDATATISNTILEDLCYQYKYDYRNRIVEKKLPGKQWEFIVYDKLDRVVATGPAFSPFNNSAVGALGWLITKYDVFNRPIYTGWELSTTITSAGRATKQNTMNGLATISESKTTTATTIDALTGIAYYTNAIAPTTFKLLTVNYYDDYTFQVFTPAIAYPALGYNNSTQKPKGLPTGSWVRVLTTLDSPTAESSYTLYDAKARPIKNYTTNYLGGYTQTDNNLVAFSGQLISTETRHKRTSNDTELYIKEAFTYSAQDRLLTHTHQIGTGGTPQLLAANSYDELGQLTSKNVGNNVATPLQKINYAYNIRGWMTEINKVATLQQGTDPKDLFAFKINYNTIDGDATAANKLYNGNIAETSWSSSPVVRTYGYKYDNLNRLKDATYQNAGTTSKAYDENLTYDKNGNIKTLQRKGLQDTQIGSMQIDDLTYVYRSNNSNQLLKVTDGINGNDAEGFIDANKTDDYTYDANGNMITDKNKGITTAITYNHLNLPTKITFGTLGDIAYIYNAVGQKINKKIKTTIGDYETEYLGSFQYYGKRDKYSVEDLALQFFPTAEGYVKNTVVNSANNYSYIFNYTDHLGNVRLSYGLNANVLTIIDENNYYPFGMKHSGYNSYVATDYKYKFQSQERQDELGLNWDAFKWRNYDYAIGRFMNIDPLAPDFPQWSPYVFSGNLVTISKELEGMEPEFLVQKDGKLTSGVITLMHAAYGYSTASLQNSTWIISTDPRVRNWDKLTGHPEASVKGTQVMYSSGVKNRSANYWLGLIGHEQSHRDEVEDEGNVGFYSKYLLQGASRKYQDIDTEATAFKFGSNDNGVDLSDKLLSYKGGAVMDIFQRGNLTNNEKASMLEAVGNQFQRDVVLQGNIDGAKSSLENLKDMKMDDKTKTNMSNLLNGLIKNWSNKQQEITKKYGK